MMSSLLRKSLLAEACNYIIGACSAVKSWRSPFVDLHCRLQRLVDFLDHGVSQRAWHCLGVFRPNTDEML